MGTSGSRGEQKAAFWDDGGIEIEKEGASIGATTRAEQQLYT
uniref:Uncharacterized protein n=1 Tax=Peronospora matthiolae TaxID=2874970 RepID=A0AAV1TDK2_9STRA